MLAESPLVIDGRLRRDDVYSVTLDTGELLYQIAVRFRDLEEPMNYVARLRWRTWGHENEDDSTTEGR